MKNINWIGAAIVIIMVCFCFLACHPDGPDLQVYAPNNNLCQLQDGKLIVSVTNAGNEAAATTMTRVSFGSQNNVDVPTPALAPGETQALAPVDLPAGCFDPDCGFSIVLDFYGAIGEINKDNNTVIGNCIG